MSARRLWIATVAISAGTACTLLTSLDDFSDGPSDAGDERSASPEAGGGGVDASTDTGTDPVAPSRYAIAVLADAPILYLRLGETNGAPARDEVTGATFTYPVSGGKFGSPGALVGDPNTAITLDGNFKLQLSVPADFEGNVPFTVEAWVSPSAANTGIGFLIDNENWDQRRGWMLHAGKDAIGFERWLDGGSSSIGTQPVAIDGTWHHIVMSSDGTVQRLYVDAVLRNSGPASVPLAKIGIPWTIGGQNCSCSSTFYAGGLDEVALYGKALTEERILAHSAAGH
jgi:hypothetical protein